MHSREEGAHGLGMHAAFLARMWAVPPLEGEGVGGESGWHVHHIQNGVREHGIPCGHGLPRVAPRTCTDEGREGSR